MAFILGEAAASRPTAGRCIPGQAKFVFDTINPLAMKMTVSFAPLNIPVCWEFARCLVDGALQHPGETYGMGDVSVAVVAKTTVAFTVKGEKGPERFLVATDGLEDFMVRTYVATPTKWESEHLSTEIDIAIHHLLAVGE